MIADFQGFTADGAYIDGYAKGKDGAVLEIDGQVIPQNPPAWISKYHKATWLMGYWDGLGDRENGN